MFLILQIEAIILFFLFFIFTDLHFKLFSVEDFCEMYLLSTRHVFLQRNTLFHTSKTLSYTEQILAVSTPDASLDLSLN